MSTDTCALPKAPAEVDRGVVAAGVGVLTGIGIAALWVGLAEGAVTLWGVGAACLTQVPLALVAAWRLREGQGNRGLDTELRALRFASHLLRLLSLGVALAAAAALVGGPTSPQGWGGGILAPLALGAAILLWRLRASQAARKPGLASEAHRARALAEWSALLGAGVCLGRIFPWGDPAVGLALACHFFMTAQALGKVFAVRASCGGCSCG